MNTIIPFRRARPRQLSPERLRPRAKYILPPALAVKQFDDDQTKRVLASAKKRGDLPQAAERFTQIANAFQLRTLTTVSLREAARRFDDASRKAKVLSRDIRALTGVLDATLISMLEDFSKRCSEEAFSEKDQAKLARRQQPQAMVTRGLTSNLAAAFAQAFKVEPTSAPEGPFHRFVDAFLTVLATNAAPAAKLKLPQAATLLKHLAALHKLNPQGFVN